MKIHLIIILIIFSITGLDLHSQTGKDPIAKKQDAAQNNIHLLLPQALYAVPGTELNKWIHHIICTIAANAPVFAFVKNGHLF